MSKHWTDIIIEDLSLSYTKPIMTYTESNIDKDVFLLLVYLLVGDTSRLFVLTSWRFVARISSIFL